jgi:hypothetical protein
MNATAVAGSSAAASTNVPTTAKPKPAIPLSAPAATTSRTTPTANTGVQTIIECLLRPTEAQRVEAADRRSLVCVPDATPLAAGYRETPSVARQFEQRKRSRVPYNEIVPSSSGSIAGTVGPDSRSSAASVSAPHSGHDTEFVMVDPPRGST